MKKNLSLFLYFFSFLIVLLSQSFSCAFVRKAQVIVDNWPRVAAATAISGATAAPREFNMYVGASQTDPLTGVISSHPVLITVGPNGAFIEQNFNAPITPGITFVDLDPVPDVKILSTGGAWIEPSSSQASTPVPTGFVMGYSQTDGNLNWITERPLSVTKVKHLRDRVFFLEPEKDGYTLGSLYADTGDYVLIFANAGTVTQTVPNFASGRIDMTLKSESNMIAVGALTMDPATRNYTIWCGAHDLETGILIKSATFLLPNGFTANDIKVAEMFDGSPGAYLNFVGYGIGADGQARRYNLALDSNFDLVDGAGALSFTLLRSGGELSDVGAVKHVPGQVGSVAKDALGNVVYTQTIFNGTQDFAVNPPDGTVFIGQGLAVGAKSLISTGNEARTITVANQPSPLAPTPVAERALNVLSENSDSDPLNVAQTNNQVVAILTRVIPDNEISPIVVKIFNKYCNAS